MNVRTVVILCDYAFIKGGASKVALASARELAQRDIGVILLAAAGPVDPSLAAAGVRVHCLDQRDVLDEPDRARALRQGLWNWRAARRLQELLGGCDPYTTIVHFHQWTKALSPSVFFAEGLAAFHSVVTHHDYFCSCPNGGFLVYPSEVICGYDPLSFSCLACNCDPRHYGHKLWRVARQFIQERAPLNPRLQQNAIFVSDYSYRVLRPFLSANLNAFLLYNPVDVPQAERVVAEDNKLFVFVGRLSPEKGAKYLALAAQAVQAPVLFVGDGEQRQDIQSLLPTAEITGWVSSEQVLERMRSARALVFPSVWHEMQGLSVVEAAACGVPVIVSDPCAATEFVCNGKTGLYFRRRDVAHLIEQLKRLQDGDLVAAMSREAYDRFWRDPPSLQRHVTQLLRIYESMLGGEMPGTLQAGSS
jgi:glycosyltransferase involved in cell wall biosynthesis